MSDTPYATMHGPTIAGGGDAYTVEEEDGEFGEEERRAIVVHSEERVADDGAGRGARRDADGAKYHAGLNTINIP